MLRHRSRRPDWSTSGAPNAVYAKRFARIAQAIGLIALGLLGVVPLTNGRADGAIFGSLMLVVGLGSAIVRLNSGVLRVYEDGIEYRRGWVLSTRWFTWSEIAATHVGQSSGTILIPRRLPIIELVDGSTVRFPELDGSALSWLWSPFPDEVVVALGAHLAGGHKTDGSHNDPNL